MEDSWLVVEWLSPSCQTIYHMVRIQEDKMIIIIIIIMKYKCVSTPKDMGLGLSMCLWQGDVYIYV
jgi:hypothetical protein